ncbi:MAG: FkbM family methyltransferase [Erythrobacter sp.]|jgi:FkbM family methyltransferase|nr:FkbM family methyltransferase [Erythrobacter sp.]
MALTRRLLQTVRRLIERAGYEVHPKADHFISDQVALLPDRAAPVIFDIGANNGKFAHSYRTCLPSARVFCLEPIPHLAAKLREEQAGSREGVEVIEAALSDADGYAPFFINEFEDTSSLLQPDSEGMPESYRSAMKPKKRVEVRTTRLDTLMRQCNLERIDILKMDIQGGEYAALKGAAESLAARRISIIALEVFMERYYRDQPVFGDIAALLARYDYRLHRLYNISFSGRNGRPQWADAIFIAPSPIVAGD